MLGEFSQSQMIAERNTTSELLIFLGAAWIKTLVRRSNGSAKPPSKVMHYLNSTWAKVTALGAV